MNPHFILYAARPEHFAKAIDSISDCLDFTIVLDNRSEFDDVCSPQEATPHKITVRKPEVALGVSQALTLCMYIARDMGAPWFSYCHDDAVVIDNGLVRVRTIADWLMGGHVQTKDGKPWSMILTHCIGGPSDVLCVYNVAACLSIGGYDWLSFPDYHGDLDLYSRLNLAGYTTVMSDVMVHHRDADSATHRVSQHRMRAHEAVDEGRRKLWHRLAQERGIVI